MSITFLNFLPSIWFLADSKWQFYCDELSTQVQLFTHEDF